MKDKRFLLILAALALLISCSLERSPLDPVISGKYPPDIDSLWTVSNIIKWNVAVTDGSVYADGYYIYGAYSENYYGKYDRVGQNYNKNDTTISVGNVSHEYVWFQVSSYILCPDTLEGHRSETIARP